MHACCRKMTRLASGAIGTCHQAAIFYLSWDCIIIIVILLLCFLAQTQTIQASFACNDGKYPFVAPKQSLKRKNHCLGLRVTSNDDDNNKPEENALSFTTTVSQRHRQVRRPHKNRRPRGYWLNIRNIETEVIRFWKQYGIMMPLLDTKTLLIPNETLLLHCQRHDLRAAIAKQGGRNALQQSLPNAEIIPGRWNQAIHIPQVRQLVQQLQQSQQQQSEAIATSTNDELPTTTTTTMTKTTMRARRMIPTCGDTNMLLRIQEKNQTTIPKNPVRWLHSPTRKPKGYWSLQILIQELYEYLDWARQNHGRPAVWMPKLSELAFHGRDDLRQAIHRYGGVRRIVRAAGMVEFREWYYFEGQLELMMLLKKYIDEYQGGDYRTFPSVSEIERHGYRQLHALIQYYGGRKYLAARFGMYVTSHNKSGRLACDSSTNVFTTTAASRLEILQYGTFDLNFAIRLLSFIRNEHLHRNPPLTNPVLAIPSRSRLLLRGSEGAYLDSKIVEYGGYENVARRLQLALLFPDKNMHPAPQKFHSP